MTDVECYTSSKAVDYRGFTSTTESGKTCQKWTSQTPHDHSRTPSKYPNVGLGDHNYCRNPDGENRAWCYTTDPNERWDYCDVGQPQSSCNGMSFPFSGVLFCVVWGPNRFIITQEDIRDVVLARGGG